MQPVLPLEKMTREEKLRIMEELWVGLSRNESQFESPVERFFAKERKP